MASERLNVSGMTCEHCRGRVEKSVKAVAGVYGVYVDLAGGIAEVDFDETKADLEAIITAIRSAGYEAEVAS